MNEADGRPGVSAGGGIAIITDGFAQFTMHPGGTGVPLVVVPNRLTIGGRTYLEGVDLGAEEAQRLLMQPGRGPLTVQPPTTADFVTAIRRQAGARAIAIVTVSREISASWLHAQAAAQQMIGQCPIAVIDSRTISAAQGLLVRVALTAAAAGQPLDEIERQVRSAVERSYFVCYAETMESLLPGGVTPPAHAILGSLLGVKPILTIEHGRLSAMEKVRTRTQAIERLVEFAIEFTDIEAAILLQPRPGSPETARMLLDRLAVDFPDRQFPALVYSPSLAAFIGTEATGLVILERDLTEVDDE